MFHVLGGECTLCAPRRNYTHVVCCVYAGSSIIGTYTTGNTLQLKDTHVDMVERLNLSRVARDTYTRKHE